MMISYPGLTKLKTTQIVYQDCILATDCGTLEHLRELSSKRKLLEESINENSHVTEAIAREMSGGLTSRSEQDILKLANYLPLLENLVNHIKLKQNSVQMHSWISKLQIRWSSVLISSSFIFNIKGPKFHEINDMYFELAMTLFLYGSMLHEQALQVMSSDVVESATLFRKAAGIYNYLSLRVDIDLVGFQERPPEATSRGGLIMSLVCLAQAQAVCARKAEEDGKSDALLAKLHHGITEFLGKAIDTYRALNEDISPQFWEFLFTCKALHELKSQKHQVINLKSNGKVGVAIGVLREALSNAKKSIPKQGSWKLAFKNILNDLTSLLKKYERENDFLWCEKSPRIDELPLLQGVKIVSIIPYQPEKWERVLIFKLIDNAC